MLVLLVVCCTPALLQVMGIREDPYEFFLDMFKLALALQLGSAGLVFYGAELLLGLDAGDGFRAVAGLALGYFLRLGIKIEHLVGGVQGGVCRECVPMYQMHPQSLPLQWQAQHALVCCSAITSRWAVAWSVSTHVLGSRRLLSRQVISLLCCIATTSYTSLCQICLW